MYYDATQIGLFLILTNLTYLSFIDIKYREVKNIELLPSLIIGVFTRAGRLLSIGKWIETKRIGLYLIGIALIVFLYIGGFLGGADVKLIFILLLLLDPTTDYGITSNLDCIQFLYYFLVSILLFYIIRFIHNILTVYRTNYQIPPQFSVQELVFLCTIYRLQKISKVTSTQHIVLEINSKNMGFQTSIYGILCWINARTPMVPFIAFSMVLTIFT